MILQLSPVRIGSQILGLAVLAGVVAAVAAAAYRSYVHSRAPAGPTALIGLAAVAVTLNTTAAFGQVLGGETDPLAARAVVFNVLAFLAAGTVAPLGARLGDRLAVAGVAVAGGREVESEVGRLVEVVGRVVAVQLPDHRHIESVDGYEPVAAETRAAMADKTLLFSRRLSVERLREQVRGRLIEEYEVGTVDVEIDPDGTVTYLAVGRRPTGIGHSLAPGTAAVAVTADPAHAAAPGDLVAVYESSRAATDGAGANGASDSSMDGAGSRETADASRGSAEASASRDEHAARASSRRVTTAEVRATAGDTVTLAVSTEVAGEIAGGHYRLVTLPFEPPVERELASVLRAADATAARFVVDDASDAVGRPATELDATIAAVEPADGPMRLAGDEPLAPGDAVYVVGSHETVRRVERVVGATT